MQSALSFIVLAVISIFDGGFIKLFEGVRGFLNNGVNYVPDETLLTTLKVVPAGMVLALVMSLFGVYLAKIFGADFTSHSGYDKLKQKKVYFFVFLIIFFEEGLFRVLPIFLSKWLNMSPVIPLIISSVLFGVIHWYNYKKKPSILVTLPQMLSGFILAIVAVNFGIVAAIVFHLYFDFVLFSSCREQKYSLIDVIIGGYFTILAVAGYYMSKDVLYQLIGILHWTAPIPDSFHPNIVEGIGLLFVFQGTISAFTHLVGYDSVLINKSIEKMSLITQYGTFLLVSSSIAIIAERIYANVNFVHSNPLICFFMFTLIFFIFEDINSVSQMSYRSLMLIPGTLSYFVYVKAGYPQMLLLLAVETLSAVAFTNLQKHND
jgi:hypothetical protein